MTYIRYKPSPPLDSYINYLYYLEGARPYLHEKILPLPVLDMKINLGGAVHVYDSDHSDRCGVFAESWWVGLWTVPHALDWPHDLRLFGVNFKPFGAYPFLQFPLSELQNQIVPLDAIWGRAAAEFRERLLAVASIPAGFALLEKLLLARLHHEPPAVQVVRHATATIARQRGALSIGELSERVSVSQNYLGMLVKRMIGVPAKELAKLYRFEHVLQSIQLTHPSAWTIIAHQSGYYDQSHFNKEFVALTGHKPTDFLQLRRQAHDKDPALDQFLRNLPIE